MKHQQVTFDILVMPSEPFQEQVKNAWRTRQTGIVADEQNLFHRALICCQHAVKYAAFCARERIRR